MIFPRWSAELGDPGNDESVRAEIAAVNLLTELSAQLFSAIRAAPECRNENPIGYYDDRNISECRVARKRHYQHKRCKKDKK